MLVSVNKTWEDTLTLKIYDARASAYISLGGNIGADKDDPVTLNGNRLCFWCSVISRVNVSVIENEIGRLNSRLQGRQAQEHRAQNY